MMQRPGCHHPQSWLTARLAVLVAVLALGAFLPSQVHARSTVRLDNLHPLDGPDADIRIIIGKRAVVMNVGVNLVFMDDLVDVPRETPGDLHAVEHAAAGRILFDFFRNDNEVLINGEAVEPMFTD
ncbi:MAG: hypothetical protein ACOC0P_02180, partial [Planctomycetota bacterium]